MSLGVRCLWLVLALTVTTVLDNNTQRSLYRMSLPSTMIGYSSEPVAILTYMYESVSK